MILPTDIPTRADIDRLIGHRAPVSVSIYLPADPASNGEPERIAFKTLAGQAVSRLRDAGTETNVVGRIDDGIGYLLDDDLFWRYQARSLAVFTTPEWLITFRLPHRLTSQVLVSDRLYLRPLLRARTFPHVAFVLALASGSVRVIEVTPELGPLRVKVEDLPSDVASAVGKSSIADRAPVRRVQGSEGQKIRLHQYARQIDRALRPLLNGLDTPLILAAAEPIASIYGSVNTYPHLLDEAIPGNPEALTDAELTARARTVMDNLYAEQLLEVHDLYGRRTAQGRTVSDIAELARAATFGAVDTLLMDVDAALPGEVDDETGAVTFASAATADVHDVIDEIARRAWLNGARVLAVRENDIPAPSPAAAILRYTR